MYGDPALVALTIMLAIDVPWVARAQLPKWTGKRGGMYTDTYIWRNSFAASSRGRCSFSQTSLAVLWYVPIQLNEVTRVSVSHCPSQCSSSLSDFGGSYNLNDFIIYY